MHTKDTRTHTKTQSHDPAPRPIPSPPHKHTLPDHVLQLLINVAPQGSGQLLQQVLPRRRQLAPPFLCLRSCTQRTAHAKTP